MPSQFHQYLHGAPLGNLHLEFLLKTGNIFLTKFILIHFGLLTLTRVLTLPVRRLNSGLPNNIFWNFHLGYSPQTADLIESHNGLLKETLFKLLSGKWSLK